MKIGIRLASLLLVLAGLNSPAFADDSDQLQAMLHSFLGASHTLPAHEAFWADDLVYTSSNGTRFGKADILRSFEGSEASDPAPGVVYTGVDVDIRLYGDTAVVAFKLVGTPADGSDEAVVEYYFNTGTFLKRDGVWRAVAWQATKIPTE